MKCVLIGGAGFIGSHLAVALIARGHAVRVFDQRGRKLLPAFPNREDVEWLEGDLADPRHAAHALAGCDAVYHLASATLPKTANDDPTYDLERNVLSTLRMLDLARSSGIRKVIFVSSGGTVYGVSREIPIAESHPTEPITAYGIGKLAIEKYLHLHHVLYGLDYTVLRFANPFGERQQPGSGQGAVTAFLQRALLGQPIEIWGDGSVVRDYFYVGDGADALVRALDCVADQRVINIGSGVGRDLNEIVRAIEALVGHSVERRYYPERRFDVPVNVLDISRARTHLGWVPSTPFEEGLRRTAAWLKQQSG